MSDVYESPYHIEGNFYVDRYGFVVCPVAPAESVHEPPRMKVVICKCQGRVHDTGYATSVNSRAKQCLKCGGDIVQKTVPAPFTPATPNEMFPGAPKTPVVEVMKVPTDVPEDMGGYCNVNGDGAYYQDSAGQWFSHVGGEWVAVSGFTVEYMPWATRRQGDLHWRSSGRLVFRPVASGVSA